MAFAEGDNLVLYFLLLLLCCEETITEENVCVSLLIYIHYFV